MGNNKDTFEDWDACFDAISNAREMLLRHPDASLKTQAAYDGLIMVEEFMCRRELKERKISELIKAAKAVVKAR